MSSLPEQIESAKPEVRFRKDFSLSVMRFAIAAVILTAASLKAHQLATTPSLGNGILEARWFNIFVVEFELLFGFWLVFGLLPKLTWLASFGLFSVFATVSVFKGLSGEASCGCFGEVAINPWLTAAFDLAVVGLLIGKRPKGILQCENIAEIVSVLKKRQVLGMVALWLIIAIPVTCAMLAVQKSDLAELGTEFVGADGRKTILLEPEKWVGKEFPLWPYLAAVEIREHFQTGDWTVVLYHHDCEKCLSVMSKLSDSQANNVLCIEVPPHSTVRNSPEKFEYAKLTDKRAWFVNTPMILAMNDAIINHVTSNTE